MDPIVQIRKPWLEIRLVVLPPQPIHAGRRIAPEREEPQPQKVDADMVEQRREPVLLPFLRSLSYALQRLGHSCPSLLPERALLACVPLGPRPWLHQFRCLSLGLFP